MESVPWSFHRDLSHIVMGAAKRVRGGPREVRGNHFLLTMLIQPNVYLFKWG